MKKFFIFVLFSTLLYADSYYIKYKGTTLGEIDTLSTLKNDYLKARVTNFIVKLLLRKKYYIFYDGKKPQSEDTKFRKDNKKIIFALKSAIAQKPKNKRFDIDKTRYITLKCKKNICKFDYFSSGQHNATGDIEFLPNGDFYRLKENKSSLEIVKK